MRTAKEILWKDFHIDESTHNHNYAYLYKSVLLAMEIYSDEVVKNISSNSHVIGSVCDSLNPKKRRTFLTPHCPRCGKAY